MTGKPFRPSPADPTGFALRFLHASRREKDMGTSARLAPRARALAKCATGVRGLDEITGGGLPRGRPTLICGGAGSGKTLLAMEFIVRGARDFDEPGVFMTFEETAEDLAANVASLGFDLRDLAARGKLAIDYVRVERSEIEETGEYDLEGLFVRLATAIASVGAKRVALDSLEALFAGLPSEGVLRAELRRLFSWLRQRGMTAVITAEQGRDRNMTRHGLEEYVSDCVVFLDHRVVNQVATRRLRVVKYRGTAHGTNEFPVMIDKSGLSVLPISSVGLNYGVTTARIPTGVAALDAMFGGAGYYRGSSVLVSGTAGTGKSSVAASFAEAACRRGERCLYVALEEAPAQIERNMSSIGIRLRPWVRRGRLRFHAVRATLYGLEHHLVAIQRLVEEFGPQCVVMDPVSNLGSIGDRSEVRAMLTRMIDVLKARGITAVFTSLAEGGDAVERTNSDISSLMDTWLLLAQQEQDGDRRRLLYILKSRGMAHSSRVRAFRFTKHGIELEGGERRAARK